MKDSILDFLQSNKIPFSKNEEKGTLNDIPYEDRTQVRGKFVSGYCCKSQLKKGQKKCWKIEIRKLGAHVKWVATREEAVFCIDQFENH